MRNIKLIVAHVIFILLAIIILAAVIYGTWLFSLKSWLYASLFFIIVGLPLFFWLFIRYARWKGKFEIHKATLTSKIKGKPEINEESLTKINDQPIPQQNLYREQPRYEGIPWDPEKYKNPISMPTLEPYSVTPQTNNGERKPLSSKVKNEIIQRSHNACENPDCQIKYPIHIHHIDMNRENNNKKNLIALCPTCHKDAHNGILINSQLRNWARADYNRLKRDRDGY